MDPDHLIALQNLGNAYRQDKRWEDAKSVLQRALQLSPENPEANYGLGMVFAQLNDTEHAYEYLQKALAARPAYPEALNNLGILYLRTQRRDEAESSFKESIRVAPAFDQAYLNLARLYAIEGDAQKARTVLLRTSQAASWPRASGERIGATAAVDPVCLRGSVTQKETGPPHPRWTGQSQKFLSGPSS